MRKIIATIFIFCAAAVGCQAYDIELWDVYYHLLPNGEASVTKGEKAYTGFINIPDSIVCDGKTYRVTAIDGHAFTACAELTSVRLPAHLRTIGEAAFSQCSSLGYIRLPESLISIGDAAFYGCSKLASLKIPASVSSIGHQAMAHCQQLSAITVNDGNDAFVSSDGILYNKAMTAVLAYPNAKSSKIRLPEGTVSVAPWAFNGCTRLKEVEFPTTLTEIGDAAFYGCTSLRRIIIREGLQTVGHWSFAECKSLTDVTLPASVKSVQDDSFCFCDSLCNIFVSNGNANYCSSEGVLMNKALTEIIAIPGAKEGAYRVKDGVRTLKGHAFYGSNALSSVIIPASVEDIAQSQFAFCDSLREIVIDNGNSLYSAVDGILLNKEQTDALFCPNGREGDIVLPESVSKLSEGAFMLSQKVRNISLPSTLTSIGDYAFMGCYNLTGITIPESLKSIGKNAFTDCVSLSDIIACGQAVSTSDFNTLTNQNATLFVTEGATDDFKSTTGWSGIQQVQEYGIYLPYDNAEREGHHQVTLCASQPIPLTAVSTDIVLPDGFKIVGATLSEANSNTHSITCTATGDHTFHLAIQPSDHQTLANEEALCQLTLEISPDVPTGLATILLTATNLQFRTQHLQGHAQQKDMTCSIQINVNTGINEQIATEQTGKWPADIYNLQGAKIRSHAYSLKGLPGGVYIVNGHKVIVN